MNQVIEQNGELVCSCGARAKHGKARFRKRHPALCSQKQKDREFTHQLAQTTRSVGVDMPDSAVLSDDAQVWADWIYKIETLGRRLTEWEQDFMASITEQFKNSGFLTTNQVRVLKRIYDQKT